MNEELNYKLNVEPAIFGMMNGTVADITRTYPISKSDIERAVWTWVMDRLTDGPPPLWMIAEMTRLDAKADGAMTIEGEAG